MLVFVTNKAPLFRNFFLRQIRKKYVITEISTKNRIICDTDSINVWILAEEACCFTNFSSITS